MFIVHDEIERTVKLIDDFLFEVVFEVKVMENADADVVINFFMLYSSIVL